MIRDFRGYDGGPEIDADVCIIGAGAAGITLARALTPSRRVLLLESGAFEFENATQALYRGTRVGVPYFDLDATRLRFLGGTTNHWGGNCGILTAFEMSRRSWVPHSGWPLRSADLLPYYRRALPIVRIGPYAFDDRAWRLLRLARPPFHPSKLDTRFLHRAAEVVRFGQDFRAELQRARRIDVVLNANATQIVANPDGRRIDGLEIRSLSGRAATVRARDYVLACGGMENARLLLASNRVQRSGIGNAHGLVGRYFMDHPSIKLGYIFARAPQPILDLVGDYRQRRVNDVTFRPALMLSNTWMTQKSTLSCRMLINPPEAVSEAEARTVPGDLIEPGNGPLTRWPVYTIQEQAPNLQSRITLSAERDALGMQRIRLDWRLSPLDLATSQSAARALGEEMGRLNAGRFRIEPWLLRDEATWPGIVGQNHHMGTTRMSDQPSAGVVNRNGRVHGIANLFVAGSSVFPSCGSDNPTFTIVALALRLGDHLAQRP